MCILIKNHQKRDGSDNGDRLYIPKSESLEQVYALNGQELHGWCMDYTSRISMYLTNDQVIWHLFGES